MYGMQTEKNKYEDGFTLIELMIVVLIVGLMVGLVGLGVFDQAVRAKQTAASAQMKTFEDALGLFKLDEGRYPTTEEGLEALVSPPSGSKGYLMSGDVPKDPWNQDYVYFNPGPTGQDYEILSYGADGQPGGEDEDADISNWGEAEEK